MRDRSCRSGVVVRERDVTSENATYQDLSASSILLTVNTSRRSLICKAAIAWRVLLFLAASSGIASAATIDCARLAAQMRRSKIPEVAVAVFSHGRVESVFCSSSAKPLAADSIFEAASLSKPVFAYGVLKLVRDHRLDLDKPLAEYLDRPYEHEHNPFGQGVADTTIDPRFAKITARMVLSHTSGLPNWSHHGPLTFLNDPGERWSYSGEGYVYLQRVVEAITDQSTDAFLENAVLLPLGMTHSSFTWQAAFSSQAMPGHSATGTPASIDQFSRPVVSSTLYTTLGDYSRFLMKMLQPAADSPFLLEEKGQVAVRPNLNLYWGLGLAIERARSDSYFHWGANPGFQSFFLCQPVTGRGVLFLTDSDNGLDLVNYLVHAAVPGSHPVLGFPMLHPKN